VTGLQKLKRMLTVIAKKTYAYNVKSFSLCYSTRQILWKSQLWIQAPYCKHWRRQKFWLGRTQNRKILWRYFGDVFSVVMTLTFTEMTSKLIFWKFDFVIIHLKNHNFGKSRNFRISDISQLKFSLEIRNLFIINS